MPSRGAAARAAHYAIRGYQLSVSGLFGRQCRYLPTCSDYTDEAIAFHGLWAGSWMGAARLCRCHPWGGSGFDPVTETLPSTADWRLPWRYGRWRFADDAEVRNEPKELPTGHRP